MPSLDSLQTAQQKGKHIMAKKKTATKGAFKEITFKDVTYTLDDPIFAEIILPRLHHSLQKRIAFRDRVERDTVKITIHADLDFKKVSIIFFDKNGEVITVGGISTGDHPIKSLLADMDTLNARITRISLEPAAINATEIMICEITAI